MRDGAFTPLKGVATAPSVVARSAPDTTQHPVRVETKRRVGSTGSRAMDVMTAPVSARIWVGVPPSPAASNPSYRQSAPPELPR